MKNIKWLIEIADRKPLLFSVAILLITVFVLASVVKDRDGKLNDCTDRNDIEKKVLQDYYNGKLDSLTVYYRNKENRLNEEVKATLGTIIDNYKEELQEQKELNQKISNTIKKTKSLITKNKKQIKILNDDEK
jgi:hypothetical protein